MARAVWKGPFVEESLMKKVDKYTKIYDKKVSKYVSNLGYLPFNVSNAFVKAWEIYNTFDFDFKDTVKSFHFAELPGQFILSLLYFLKINSSLNNLLSIFNM